jgi:hypothetical protein
MYFTSQVVSSPEKCRSTSLIEQCRSDGLVRRVRIQRVGHFQRHLPVEAVELVGEVEGDGGEAAGDGEEDLGVVH